MQYVKFESQELALEFSENMCEQKGCSGVTKYWYKIAEAGDGWYAVIHDDAIVEGATATEPQWVSQQPG